MNRAARLTAGRATLLAMPLTRRSFLAAAAVPAAGQVRTQPPPAQAVPLIKPAALRPGDTVGLITPGTYVSDPDRLALARRTVEYFGLKPRLGRNVARRTGYLGGSDEERLEDLHAMFRDPDVRAVFCIRGGVGSARLLDRVDYGLIRSHPKVFLGFSDITSLHLAIHQKTGLVTFHGPVLISAFSDYTQQWFRKALFGSEPLGLIRNPEEANALRPNHTTRTVRPGRASGPLLGGNLTLLTQLMGTPFEPQTRGRLLFLEDVDEQPYNVDRMLTQLRLAGKLESAAGIIWGECSDCVPRDYKPSFESTFSTGEVVDQILGRLNVPVLSGLTIGHTADQLTLPLGVQATLDAGAGTLAVEETATQS